jgi:hypothetical protein
MTITESQKVIHVGMEEPLYGTEGFIPGKRRSTKLDSNAC